MLSRDFSVSSNKGANKTRRDQERAIKGTKHKAPKKTRGTKYKKAVEDAKAAFLMQTGYNQQRSNFDIITPIKTAKNAIKGNEPSGKGSVGGPEFVDNYDRAVARVGKNKQYKGKLHLNNGGPRFVDDFDRTVKKLSKKDDPKPKPKEMKPKNRMKTSETRRHVKASDYAPMIDASSFGATWSRKDRFRDSSKRSKRKTLNFAERNITSQAVVEDVPKSKQKKVKKKVRKKVTTSNSPKVSKSKTTAAKYMAGGAASIGAMAGATYLGLKAGKSVGNKIRRKRKEKNEEKS